MVVVADVLSAAEEARRSATEVWDCMERTCASVRRDDPRTWERWCSLSTLGFLGNQARHAPPAPPPPVC